MPLIEMVSGFLYGKRILPAHTGYVQYTKFTG
jgi:hypothetical protein